MKRPTKLESWKWHEAGCTPSCWRFPGLYEWLESWRESTLPVAVKVDPSIFRLNQADIWLSLHLLPDRISHLSALEDFRTDDLRSSENIQNVFCDILTFFQNSWEYGYLRTNVIKAPESLTVKLCKTFLSSKSWTFYESVFSIFAKFY